MASVTYTARRSLAPLHAAGSDYVLRLMLINADPVPKRLATMTETMSGAVETLYFGRAQTWDVTLAAMQLSQAALIIEFLESTYDGQVFDFDPYGWPGQPRLSMQVVRSDDGYSARRALQLMRGGHDDYFNFSFQVREV